MRHRLNALLRRLGAAGIVGLGVLIACAAFYVSAVVPREDDAAAQRLALERLKARTPQRPTATSARADELRRFYGMFP